MRAEEASPGKMPFGAFEVEELDRSEDNQGAVAYESANVQFV